jgi:hypothetical protein
LVTPRPGRIGPQGIRHSVPRYRDDHEPSHGKSYANERPLLAPPRVLPLLLPAAQADRGPRTEVVGAGGLCDGRHSQSREEVSAVSF